MSNNIGFTHESLINIANSTRDRLNAEELHVRDFVEMIKETPDADGFNKGECIAQAMLALRHIEDARMRLGKVIQYADGGVSIYDKQ